VSKSRRSLSTPLLRWRHALGLALAVVLAHALLLAGLPMEFNGPPQRPLPALQVRQIVLAAAPVVAMAAPPAVVPPPPPPSVRRLPSAVPRLAAPVTPLRPPAQAEAAARDAEPEPAAPLPALIPVALTAQADTAAAPAATPAAVAPAEPPPPTYPTKPPPPAVLRYELRRGVVRGQGEVHWRPEGRHYELQIEGSAFGLPLLSQTSSGGFDAAGLAPQRFVDRRRGREQRAANFQRERGVISFSASSDEFALLPGAQDRLSWMLQLAAIVEAAPARHGAGDHVTMQVAGVRGDVEVWRFSVLGREAVEVAGGERIADALALRRDPRKPYDTRVEVWLDPRRHHLPVRLKLGNATGNDALELLLQP
jgi:hypothetical protein